MTHPVSEAHSLAGRLVGFDLPGGFDPPSVPLSDPEWAGFEAVVRAQRVQGVLAHAIEQGRWPSTARPAGRAATAHREAMASVLVLDQRLRALGPALDSAGIRWRVLKGPAIAHLDEPDPSWRVYGDLDLLVSGDDIAPTLDLLAGLGGERRYSRPSASFDRRFGKGASVPLPDGVEIDLHRTLALGPYGLALDPRVLLDLPTESFEVGGVRIEAMSRAGRFLHACYHAILGQELPRLSALRDLALTYPSDEDAAREVHHLARTFGGEAVMACAISTAASTLGWIPQGALARWAQHLEPHERDTRWLGAYRGPEASSRRRTLLAAEALPDVPSRIAYFGAVLVGLASDRARTAAANSIPTSMTPSAS